MRVNVDGTELPITRAQVVPGSVRTFATNIVEGQLVGGRTFRADCSLGDWHRWCTEADSRETTAHLGRTTDHDMRDYIEANNARRAGRS